jgi:hypothetical protein
VATWKDVCETLDGLPGTALDSPDDGSPAWRVNGKVLVRSNPRLRIPDEDTMIAKRGEVVAIRVFDRSEREALLQQDPRVFFITPHWETSPSVLVWIEDVPVPQLRELIIDAWRARAPKRLVRELGKR